MRAERGTASGDRRCRKAARLARRGNLGTGPLPAHRGPRGWHVGKVVLVHRVDLVEAETDDK